jgi:imidazolonepropionase-like amidohydrolase
LCFAREFKFDSQLGTVEPGKIAILILLRKSPMQSADAYDSIVKVWVQGRHISPDSLAANLSK